MGEACGWVMELATYGKSPNPGLVLPRSACIAADAARLVASSTEEDGARGGDPVIFDHIHGFVTVYFRMNG
jgi:hypothetical protein